MASLADLPGEEMPYWAVAIWYRCQVCKVLFEFEEQLIKHKEKHQATTSMPTSESDSDSDPYPRSDNVDQDDEHILSLTSSSDDDESSVSTISINEDDDNVGAVSSLIPPVKDINSCLDSTECSKSQEEKSCHKEGHHPIEEQDAELLLDKTDHDSDSSTIIVQKNVQNEKIAEESFEVKLADTKCIPTTLVCTTCNLRFKSAKGLRIHWNSAHASNQYPCPFCRKKFTSLLFKDKHIENCQRPFNYRTRTYPKCSSNRITSSVNIVSTIPARPQKRATSQLLTNHFKISKTLRKQPTRLVNITGMTLRNSCNQLIKKSHNHLTSLKFAESKITPKKLPHQCHICKKMMSSQPNLRLHLRRHLLIKDKPFLCNICKLRFVTKPGLTNHLITKHSKIRNYDTTNCT